jgi:hypothetical protein
MVEGRGRPGLLHETFLGFRILREMRRQELERNMTLEFGISGLVDHTHPTLTDLLDYLEVFNQGAGSQNPE